MLCEAIPAPTLDCGLSPSACVVTAGAWVMVLAHPLHPPTPRNSCRNSPTHSAVCF